MIPTSIDGTDITGATIDGTDVTEITVDGQTVFTAFEAPPSEIYYDFSTNAAIDRSGNGNDGTVNGATHLPNGGPQNDGAFAFDGIDDYIECPVINPGTGQISFSFWFKQTGNVGLFVNNYGGSGSQNHIVFRVNPFEVQIDDGSTLEAFSGGLLSSSTWEHIACTFDANTKEVKVYQNGILLTDDIYSGGTVDLHEREYYIGAQYGASGNFSDGEFDQFRISSQIFTANEVSSLYNAEKP